MSRKNLFMNMINFIGCLIALIIGLLIGNVESIGIREIKILTIICWVIALCSIQGGLHYN